MTRPIVVALDPGLANLTAVGLAGFMRALRKARQPIPPGLESLEGVLRQYVADPTGQSVPGLWFIGEDRECLMKAMGGLRRCDVARHVGVSERTLRRQLTAAGVPPRTKLTLAHLELLVR